MTHCGPECGEHDVRMVDVFQNATRGKGHDPGSRIIQEDEKVFQKQKRMGNGQNMPMTRIPKSAVIAEQRRNQSLERVAESELPKVPPSPTGLLTKWSWTGVRNHSEGKSRIPQGTEYEIRSSTQGRVREGAVEPKGKENVGGRGRR